MSIISDAIATYCHRHGLSSWHPKAALIDMDGVLYDSMPGHARAWKQMMDEQGVPCTYDEFFLYEGMTGRATIELLMRERMGQTLPPEEVSAMYARKSEYFKAQGPRRVMPHAQQMISTLASTGVDRVLVTGSAQHSLLESLERDYPGGFAADKRVTALDVEHGKPHPEPYIIGLQKAHCLPTQAMVIENAPLGVEAGHAAGCLTIALCTGPIPAEKLYEAGADLVFACVSDFVDALPQIISGISHE